MGASPVNTVYLKYFKFIIRKTKYSVLKYEITLPLKEWYKLHLYFCTENIESAIFKQLEIFDKAISM